MSLQTRAKFSGTHSTTSVTVSVRHQVIIDIEQIYAFYESCEKRLLVHPHGKNDTRHLFIWVEEPAV
jgi:phosphopantetheinyl transferase